MKRIGIFFGSTTGTTEQLARLIAEKLNVADSDIHDVAQTAPSAVGDYDVILIGASTWGDGEVQDDMADFVNAVSQLDLKGKFVAVFGCGDESMSGTFCNAVGEIYRKVKSTGADMIGRFNADGYDFEHSEAQDGSAFVGLVIDNVNHEDLTSARVTEWTDGIKDFLAAL